MSREELPVPVVWVALAGCVMYALALLAWL
jgi:hypothetical protein